MKTLSENIKEYAPVISLTKIIGRGTMGVLRKTLMLLMVIGIVGSLITTYFGLPYAQILTGITLIVTALWIEQMMIFSYHNSFYFRGLNSILGLEDKVNSGATYDLAEIIIKNEDDVTFAFCTSQFGSNALLRSGIVPDVTDAFLNGPRPKVTTSMVIMPEDEIFSVIGLGKYLMAHDQAFSTWLKENGVQESTVLGALRWIVGSHHQAKRTQRWWSKDNLSKTTGIGGEWSYGVAYTLQKFARDIRTSAVFSTLTSDSPFADEKIEEIETSLARAKAANVMIIGEPGVGKIDLVMKIGRAHV